MDSNFNTFSEKIILFIVMIIAGLFSIVVGIIAHFFDIKGLSLKSICLILLMQMILSFGVFVGVVMFFNSDYLPSFISSSFWTMAVTAYAFASIPHLVVTTLIIVFRKEVNRLLEKRYGDSEVTTFHLDSESENKNGKSNI